MCDTRDAPQVWYEEVQELMRSLNVMQCLNIPCLNFHNDRVMGVVVLVDGLLCIGLETGFLRLPLDVLERFESTRNMIGVLKPTLCLFALQSLETCC